VADLDLGGADAAMERYARGDEAAFGELYDAIAPRLLGFLHKATRDAFAAEDLMQQTLLHMHRARARSYRAPRCCRGPLPLRGA